MSWSKGELRMAAVLVKLPPPEEEITGLQLARERQRNMTLLIIITAFEIVLLTIQLSSLAAFTAEVKNTENTAATRNYLKCDDAVWKRGRYQPNPLPNFALGMNSHREPSVDLSGNNRPGLVAPGDTFPATELTPNIGCVRDFVSPNDARNRVSIFNGSSACLTRGKESESITAPDVFTLEAWFSTTKTDSGRLIGFSGRYSGDYNATGASDRHIYLDQSGNMVFGMWPNRTRYISSPVGTNYSDGKWHHVVATLSPQGANLYMDGQRVASDPSITTGQSNVTGYWKIGCGKLLGWVDASGNAYSGPKFYKGRMQFVSVYNVALTPSQVLDHYLAGAK